MRVQVPVGQSGRAGPVSSRLLHQCWGRSRVEAFGHEVSRLGPWRTPPAPLLPAASPRAPGSRASLRPAPRQRPSALPGSARVCSLLKYCVCGFHWVCGSVWEYMSVFLDMCTCCVAVLWFIKAFIYIAAMKSCHQVTKRGSYWAGLADVTGTTAPLCLLFLLLVPDLASLVSFRFLFPFALSCFPCSSFFFLFPAGKQRGTVRLPSRTSWPMALCCWGWPKGLHPPRAGVPPSHPSARLRFALKALA